MRRVLALSVVLAVLAVVTVRADDAEYPYAGKVNATRVNVRAGAGANHRILKVAKMGEVVQVLDKSSEWLKIRCPETCTGWVHAEFVEADGDSGVVTGNNVNVRATNSTRDVSIAKLGTGDQVKILRKKDTWYEIAAPENAAAWISAKYVDYVDGYEDFLAQEKAGEGVREVLAQLEAACEKEMAVKDPEKRNLDPLIAGYTELKAVVSAQEGPFFIQVLRRCEARLAELTPLKDLQDKLASAQNELKQIDEDIDKKIEEAERESQYVAKGWVEDVGPFKGRPGSHRLKVGGETIYFLKCNKRRYNLNRYVGCYVGIIGTAARLPDRNVMVVTVEKIDLLHDRKTDF